MVCAFTENYVQLGEVNLSSQDDKHTQFGRLFQSLKQQQLDVYLRTKVTYSEQKTIIKSCLKRKWKLEHPKYNKADAYNQLERHEQVVIIRLRANHNKPKQHLYRTFKVGDTDQCPCGEEMQAAEHILQRCQLYKELTMRTWPQPTLEAQRLYGCLTDLQRLQRLSTRLD